MHFYIGLQRDGKLLFPMKNMFLCAQVMVTNVTSLLKTVKAVEDEHTRGTRALESTIEAIAQEIRVSQLFSYHTK
jgi:hypothetical protein